ncbi:MAG: DUF2199 domain-containing protein [Planctomycetes bacterium]|nr:DUF2199 domain-containing protein [Planctomycetota bacterium]MBI3843145.1 DUF2199 domain-containing protein [Planctomycetota bacterium]
MSEHSEPIRYTCVTCGKTHEGLPDIGYAAPLYYFDIPEEERAVRTSLTSDFCVVDQQHYFVRGCLEIPIIGTERVFAWGAWVSLSEKNFHRYEEQFDVELPDDDGRFMGWFSNRIRGFPDTLVLKARLHLRPNKQRPSIELEPTEHPLAVYQRDGIALEELMKLIAEDLQRAHGPDE